ncbi:MAG: hypothetical protein H0W81_01910 [Chloroflexi bacterium]|nr:hypothetical protein [Chloroflexota bacterium]
MTRKLAAGVVALCMATTLVVVTAHPVVATCSQAYLYVYEDVNQSGDWKQFCYPTGSTYLANVPHTQAGLCNSGFIRFGDHWDDCISSATYNEGSINTSVCLWLDQNYGGSGVKFTVDASASWGFGIYADAFSSIEWGYSCET